MAKRKTGNKTTGKVSLKTMLAKPTQVSINNTDYEAHPVTLNDISDMMELPGGLMLGDLTTAPGHRFLIWASLRKSAPDLTLEEVGSWFPIGAVSDPNYQALISMIMTQSGLVLEDVDGEGEAPNAQAEDLGTQTGPESSDTSDDT